MNKLKEIATAWKNVVFTPEQMKMVYQERMKVCQGCPFKDKQLGVEVCSVCHCPLLGKTHSPVNSCPKGKWRE